MRYLLDTNIVLRLANEDAEEHALTNDAVEGMIAGADEPLLVPQCIYEFWNVCTRPVRVNGLGWEVERTRLEVDRLLGLFPLLPDTPRVFSYWLELVTRYQVSGKQVHDARLAATLKVHGVEGLLTLNVTDFKRFDLKAVRPNEVLG
jgi:predicted nucleic acid-binding protein